MSTLRRWLTDSVTVVKNVSSSGIHTFWLASCTYTKSIDAWDKEYRVVLKEPFVPFGKTKHTSNYMDLFLPSLS